MRRSVREVSILFFRNLTKANRTPLLISFSLLQPLLWLIIFTQIFNELESFPEFKALGYTSYLMFFAPSMVAFTMLFSALQSGLAMITDIDTGMLEKFCISPIRRSSILLGRILADGVRMFFQGGVVLGVALLLGGRIQTGWEGALVILGVATLFGIVWSALSNFVALHTGSAELTMAVGLLLTLPVLFLTAAFFPKELLPSWLQIVTKFNPAAYVIDTARQLMNFGDDWSQVFRTLGVLVVVGVVTISGATLAFRQATH